MNVTTTNVKAEAGTGERWPGWAVALPVSLVVLLAVVLASVPVRTSAVWRHLATGRAWLEGSYTWGTDPFAYTTDGVTWVNPCWLYDVVLYEAYQLLGTNLGAVQAALAALLAGFMLLAARPGRNPWTASFSVALALVALGPYLPTLDPALVSYVLLAFLLWRLDASANAPTGRAQTWFGATLILVALLWANLDEWLLLGPLTMSLFALTACVTAAPARWTLLLAAALAWAVCIVNPHHVLVFAWPAALQDNAVTGQTATSTIQVLKTVTAATFPVPLAAYLFLLLLCFLAVVRGGARQAGPHLVVLVALAALSVYRTSALPFFAIAAGPFIARGWQTAPRPTSRRLTWLAPSATGAGLACLLVLAAPGALQGTGERRGWFLLPDPSLQGLALQLADWQQQGRLDERCRAFPLSTDAAHYLEWFCPGVKIFVDGRAELYGPEVSADFHTARQALATEQAAASKKLGLPTAQDIFARWHVGYLVVSDPVERTLVAALWQLWQAPEAWALVGLSGDATMFAWQTPPPGVAPLTLPPIRFEQLAFAPAPATRAPREASAALPVPRPWWDCLARPEAAAAQLDRALAFVYLAHFDALQPAYARRHLLAWQTKLAMATLVPGPETPGTIACATAMPAALLACSLQPTPPSGPSLLSIVQRSVAAEQQSADDGPPGSLLLAVRAARRALTLDPGDGLAYLRLGHAYDRLDTSTVERNAAAGFAQLSELRRVQAILALKSALRLRPDLTAAQQLLAGLYARAGALDLALEHLTAQLKLTRAAGPRPGETPTEFVVRVDGLAAREQGLGRIVRERLNLAATKSFNLDAYGKARTADDLGLPGRALELLQRSNYGEFGVQGAIIEVHLLCYAGYVREARAWLDPRQEAVMHTFNYQWVQAMTAAALGDYAAADEALARLQPATVDLQLPLLNRRDLPPRTALGLVIGLQLLEAATCAPGTRRDPPDLLGQQLAELAALPRRQADAEVLRGLLALEAGAIETGERHLRAGLARWNGDDGCAAVARATLALLPRSADRKRH